MKKIKICFLHGYLSVGGAEELRLTILKYFNRDKYDVTVCSMSDKGVIGEEIEKIGYKVVSLKCSQEVYDIKAMFRLYKFLKKEKPDILHTCMFNCCFHGTITGKLAGVKSIIWEEHVPEPFKKWWHFLIDRYLSRYANKIITCSDYVKEYTSKRERIDINKFYRIYNVLDFSKFNKISRIKSRDKYKLNNTIIGIVGRLHEQKGHIYLLNSLIYLKEQIPNIKLLIIGEGPEERNIKNFIRTNNLSSNVLLLGNRRDVPDLIKTLDVFVLPSIYEGFGIVLLEAMYSGIPVVASKVGGITEIIKNRYNGLIVKSRDPYELTKAIRTILIDKKIRDKIIKNGVYSVEKNYHPINYISKLESLYEEI